MFKVIKLLYNQYKHCFNELADPRTASFPLMGNPIFVIIIITAYLKFVLQWGPNFMKDRKPFNIDKLLIVYNGIQVLCSASIAFLVGKHAYFLEGYSLICEPTHKSTLTLINIGYFYFLVKLLDLLDTIFFVLRRKSGNISFLHIYHHAGMIVFVWLGLKFIPGGSVIFIPMANSAVHTVMYTYYLMTIVNKSSQTLWWKKHLTQMQIIQFLLYELNFFSAAVHPTCGFPKVVAGFLFIQNTFFLTMFSDFYYNAYIKKSSKAKM